MIDNNRYLFRGKRKDNGEWAFGSLIQKHSPHHVEKVDWCSLIHDGALTAVEVDPETVGQKISAEHDVFEHDLFCFNVDDVVAVMFSEYNCKFAFKKRRKDELVRSLGIESQWTKKFKTGYANFFEAVSRHDVIGNIHDNPELFQD